MNTSINYSGFTDLLHTIGSENHSHADQYTTDQAELWVETQVESDTEGCPVSAVTSERE